MSVKVHGWVLYYVDIYFVFHLFRIWPWWSRRPFHDLRGPASDLCSREREQRAGFLASLCDRKKPSDFLLTLSCFPTYMKTQVKTDLSKSYSVRFQGQGTSLEPLCKEDQAFISLSEAFSLQQNVNKKDFCIL